MALELAAVPGIHFPAAEASPDPARKGEIARASSISLAPVRVLGLALSCRPDRRAQMPAGAGPILLAPAILGRRYS